MKKVAFVFFSIIFIVLGSNLDRKKNSKRKRDSLTEDCGSMGTKSFTLENISELSYELSTHFLKPESNGDEDHCLTVFNKCGTKENVGIAFSYLNELIKTLNSKQKLEEKLDDFQNIIAVLDTKQSEAFDEMMKKIGDFGNSYYNCLCEEKNLCSDYFSSPFVNICKLHVESDKKGLVGLLDESCFDEMKVGDKVQYKGMLVPVITSIFDANTKYRDTFGAIISGSNTEIDTDEEMENYNENCKNVGKLTNDILKTIQKLYSVIHPYKGWKENQNLSGVKKQKIKSVRRRFKINRKKIMNRKH